MSDPGTGRRIRIGRFRILGELGQGGMGRVYVAEDPTLQRRVALKVIRENETSPQVVERLHREAAAVARLQHPHIVGVHEVGTVRDSQGEPTHFLAMDLIQGGTLARRLEERTATRDEVLRWIEEVARAATCAHDHGVVHRDIKPANILIDTSGRAMLADFGLARIDLGTSPVTKGHAVLGTPCYMAPEQVEGRSHEVDARTDVHALGAVLYEALAGRPPFLGKTAAEVYRRILEEEPPPPCSEADLALLCRTALQKDPGRRYARAVDLAEDIARYRRGEPIRARPPGVFSTISRAMMRRRRLIVAGFVIACVAVGASLVAGSLRRGMRLRERLAEARSHEREARWREAVDAYRLAIALDSEDAEAREGLARAEAALADQRERDARAHADAEQRVRDIAKAYGVLEEARALLDRASNFRYSRNASHEDVAREASRAREKLESVVEVVDDASAYEHLGASLELLGRDAEAVETWTRGLSKNPSAPSLLARRGWIRCREALRGSPDPRAARDFEEALARLPEDQELDRLRCRLGLALATGNPEEGMQAARRGIELLGDSRGAELFVLGRAIFDSGSRAKHLTAAIELCPGDDLLRLLRARERRRVGDLAGAEEDLTEALSRRPGTSGLRALRASVREELGKREEALADYRVALEECPDAQERARLKERIAALEKP